MSDFSFNLGQTTEGSSQCVGALAGQDLGLGNHVWLLGDRYLSSKLSLAAVFDVQLSFMKNVYTIFDVGSESVGFAALA